MRGRYSNIDFIESCGFLRPSVPLKYLYLKFLYFKGVLLIFYPGEYVLGALLFLLTLFFIKRDLKRLKAEDQSSLINPLNGDTSSQLDEDLGIQNQAFKEEPPSSHSSYEENKLKTT